MNNANKSEGNKYQTTRDLDVTAIAKLVRADIKALKIAGLKCSVTIERYSGGQSIHVRVVSADVQVWTNEFLKANPHHHFEGDRYTPEASELLARLESVLQAYNFDNSDTMTDYFHVRFYGNAEFCWKFAKANREQTIARNAAESRSTLAEETAHIVALEARLAKAVADRSAAAARFDAARVAQLATAAEIFARAGVFYGHA